MLHQCHLAIRSGLELTDHFLQELSEAAPNVTRGFHRYFSNVAKLCNFWRERVAEFILTFERIHGDSGHGIPYRRYPLTVVAGRWGSIHEAESFILARGRKYLVPVFLALLSKYIKANTDGTTDGHGGHGDQADKGGDKSQKKGKRKQHTANIIMDEEQAEYRIKMSKWTSGTLATISNPLFWLLLRLQNTCRGPLTHFMNWLQKHSRERAVVQLACGGAAKFVVEYEKLIASFPQWFDAAVEEAGAQELPKFVLESVQTLVAKLLWRLSSSFDARVVQPLGRQVVAELLVVDWIGS